MKSLKKFALICLVQMLKLFRFLPLFIVHAFGATIGGISYFFNRKVNALAQTNLEKSALYPDAADLKKSLFINALESGKSIIETFAIWFKPQAKVLQMVDDVSGWGDVETALAAGKGLIFLTPHLGCFEITSLYYGARQPMAVLYRPPRQRWLLPLILAGRQRGKIALAEANSHGVKQLLQALKRGEAIGVLPDQAPFEGEGEWAPFFGRPAYTMTLASKLAQKTGAQVFMAFGERLNFGRGYHIHIRPIAAGGIATPALMNAEIERTIAECPTQYLWRYARYKVRHQTPPPDYVAS
jgi:Kdo2-lipid IVA lauroyltransferase/acyltransferase